MKKIYQWAVPTLCVAAALFSTSCGQKTQQNTITTTAVKIDQDIEPLADSAVARIFTDPSYIILKGALLGDVTQILDWGDRYVIFERKQNNVYLFDTTGMLIRQVSRKGKGPQEYIQVSGIAIDGDKLVLYADLPNKMLYFDKEGDFMSEEKVDNGLCFNKGIAYSNGYLYGITSGNRGEMGHTLLRMGGGENTAYLPYENWPAAVSGGSYVNVAGSGVIWVSRPFDNNVYRIDPQSDDEPQAVYRLDFGAGNMPDGYADGIDDFDLITKARAENKVLHASRLCQIGHYLLFNTMTTYWLLDMDDNTVQKVGAIPASGGVTVKPWGYIPLEYQDRKLVMQISPLYTEEQIEQGKITRTPTLDSLLIANAEYQNPILVTYKVGD